MLDDMADHRTDECADSFFQLGIVFCQRVVKHTVKEHRSDDFIAGRRSLPFEISLRAFTPCVRVRFDESPRVRTSEPEIPPLSVV